MRELIEDYLSEELYLYEIDIKDINIKDNMVYVTYTRWIYEKETFEEFEEEIELQYLLGFIYSKTCKK